VNILGIDPGMQKLGYSGVKNSDSQLTLGKYGMIFTPFVDQKWYDFLSEGIEQIAVAFPKILQLTEPEMIVAEKQPTGKLGSNSELVIASVAVCKTIAFQWGIDWHDVAANTWHSRFLGSGVKATKAKVRNRVFAQFPELAGQHKLLKAEQKADGQKVEGFPADVTDAIAIAIVGHGIYESIDKDLQEV
jgi:Holliday junction resolvasome RuvABC endonuclease subunit